MNENKQLIQTNDFLFQEGMLERIESFAEVMARGKSTVPPHLRNNPADCMAVIMQAAEWCMNPFAVAQKTYQVAPGAPLGYEGQLVNAVIITHAPIHGRPDYTFFGPWETIQGNLESSPAKSGKTYVKPGWKSTDEVGVGVTVTVHIKGEDNPRSIDVLLTQCYPRNSTNWANDPQQQICYAAIRKIARRHFPDVIMGVYTPDELDTSHERVIDAEVVEEPASKTFALKNKLSKNAKDSIAAILDAIDRAKTKSALDDAVRDAPTLDDANKRSARKAYAAKLEELADPDPDKAEPDHSKAFTLATEQINAATTIQAVYDAVGKAEGVSEDHQRQIESLANSRIAEGHLSETAEKKPQKNSK